MLEDIFLMVVSSGVYMKPFFSLFFLLSACSFGFDTKYNTTISSDDEDTDSDAQPSNEPSSDPNTYSSSENPNLGQCGDNIDNDNDGLTDCQDSDCNSSPVCVDADNDGYSASEDCNDYNNSINPGATDIPDDHIDQDCDGQDTTSNSNGGGNNNNTTTEDCSNGIDDNANGMIDCDEYTCIFDLACIEDCSNGVDDNGNGAIDCDDYSCILDSACTISSGTDADSDGFYSISSGGNDCDDSDYYTRPGAGYYEINYNDCMTDADSDGYGDKTPSYGVIAGTDCNDTNYYVNPGAYDFIVDGTDQNCDGIDGPTTPTGVDADNDGYDSIATGGTDCDDNDSYTYPGAAYWDGSACMTDVDGDNYGDDNPNSGVVAGTDCDDSNININPAAYDLTTDGIDQDCDGADYSSSTACSSTEVIDCNGNCAPANWVGDLSCDDNIYTYQGNLIDLNCAQHNYDNGDCTSSTCPSGYIEDCDGNCVEADWLGDNICDNVYGANFDCAQYSYDNGDCSTPTQCCYDIEMYDSYGDGWDLSYLHVYVNLNWTSQHTIINGSYGLDTACVPYGSRFDLAFGDQYNTYSGLFDYEITYALYDQNNNLLITESDPPNGTRYTNTYVTCY